LDMTVMYWLKVTRSNAPRCIETIATSHPLSMTMERGPRGEDKIRSIPMRIRTYLILTLSALLALSGGVIYAQESETPAPAPQSYTVCDWGLLVLEESGGPVQDIDITSPAEFSGVGTAF